MNNPITVKIASNIDITDEHKNELREKLVYAFIEQLRKSGMYKITEGKDGYAWILRVDLILPKKHEAEPVNGWISVKDRLPEIGENYCSKLVMCYTPDGEHEYLFDYYEVNGFGQGCFTAEKYFGISITHWQPLPEPPKGE